MCRLRDLPFKIVAIWEKQSNIHSRIKLEHLKYLQQKKYTIGHMTQLITTVLMGS